MDARAAEGLDAFRFLNKLHTPDTNTSINCLFSRALGIQQMFIHLLVVVYISVPASPDQGHDRLCRRGVGRVFLAGVRPDSPSRRRIPSCYRPGPGRGVVVELGQRGAH